MAVIWIAYTTQYRDGGPKFERAARTLAADKRRAHPSVEVRCERVESKRDVVNAMQRITAQGERLTELHFVGHSGMYGPMFRSTAMPEQFSPHEWRELAAQHALPFADGSSAYFHACRTARWFAPFFARTFGVPVYGYHGYTTVSLRPDAFQWEGALPSADAPLYLIACAGRKSHGLLGSVAKYAGLARAEVMKRFEPVSSNADGSYDGVAELYDRAFSDIRVRAREVAFIEACVERAGTRQLPRVLDIGAGNGALLCALRPHLRHGVGVDSSDAMIARARARASKLGADELEFHTITGPKLPFPDGSFDVITSLLSFRYLDWDPMMNELRRVLAPGGRIVVVDMVAVPARLLELPYVLRGKLDQLALHLLKPDFRRNLRALVSDTRWKAMLQYNPIRAEHELKWYLESRFPGRTVETLDIAHDSRVLAFDSGPLQPGWVPPQSYP